MAILLSAAPEGLFIIGYSNFGPGVFSKVDVSMDLSRKLLSFSD